MASQNFQKTGYDSKKSYYSALRVYGEDVSKSFKDFLENANALYCLEKQSKKKRGRPKKSESNKVSRPTYQEWAWFINMFFETPQIKAALNDVIFTCRDENININHSEEFLKCFIRHAPEQFALKVSHFSELTQLSFMAPQGIRQEKSGTSWEEAFGDIDYTSSNGDENNISNDEDEENDEDEDNADEI